MLELEVPYRKVDFSSARDSEGLGNVEVAAKYLLTDQGHFAAAINLGIEVPAGDDGQDIASDRWAVELSVPVSFQFPSVHSMHLELGTGWKSTKGSRKRLPTSPTSTGLHPVGSHGSWAVISRTKRVNSRPTSFQPSTWLLQRFRFNLAWAFRWG